MSRRITVFTAALALTAGAALVGAGAAQARSVPNLTIAINHSSFVATQNAVLSIHLGGPGGGQKVTLVRTLPSGTQQSGGTLTTDAHGNVRKKLPVVYTARYTVVWGGNSSWLAGRRSTGVVKVAAYTATKLHGDYDTRGRYHLFHAGKRGELDLAVFPSKAGQKANFPLQTYYAGTWHTKVNRSFTLKAFSEDGIEVSATGTTFEAGKGYPARIRAEYHGDKYNLGRVSGWYYVEFV